VGLVWLERLFQDCWTAAPAWGLRQAERKGFTIELSIGSGTNTTRRISRILGIALARPETALEINGFGVEGGEYLA
jgi:hypothetical protein